MSAHRLRAGAAKREIALRPINFPVDGFTGVHDPLYARVLVVDDGHQKLALVSIEVTSLPAAFVSELQDAVGSAAEVAPRDVVVAATHTFSAPHVATGADRSAQDSDGRGTRAADALLAAATAAARSAASRMRPARLGAGSGWCRVAVNRDAESVNGWWLGADDDAAYDPEVTVAVLEDLHGETLAVIFGYAVQSSVMNESIETDGGRLVTGDLAGAAARVVERELGDPTVALFLVGAAGDQAPYLASNRHIVDAHGNAARHDVGSAGHLLVELLGERLGLVAAGVALDVTDCFDATVSLTCHSLTVLGQVAPQSFRDLSPDRNYRFDRAESQEVPFWLMRLGSVSIVGLQPELSSATGTFIKQHSAAQFTVVATMVNGAAKYMPDFDAYERKTYAAMSARFAQGSAEALGKAVIEALASESPVVA